MIIIIIIKESFSWYPRGDLWIQNLTSLVCVPIARGFSPVKGDTKLHSHCSSKAAKIITYKNMN
jgi:hypothetical protein